MAQPTTLGAAGSSSATGVGIGAYTAFTYTVSAGSNRGLLLFLSTGDNEAGSIATDVTYGGQAMTEVSHLEDAVIWTHTQMWFLNEAGIAAAGSTTFSITMRNTNDHVIFGAQAFQGVSQATSTGTPVTATGNSVAPSTGSLTLTSDQIGIGCLCTDDNGAFTSDNTQIFQVSGVGGDTGGAAEYRTSTGALTWTTAAQGWTVIGVPLNGISGGDLSVSSIGEPVVGGSIF